MKGHIAVLVTLAVLALAIMVYAEQTKIHAARIEIASMFGANSAMGTLGPAPEPDADVSEFAAADYPKDIADSIPVPASGAPELRRGVAFNIVLAGMPSAPRARPAQPRGIAVARHAADLTGQQIVPVPAQEDLLA